MQQYEGTLKTRFWWVIPALLGVSVSDVAGKATVLALHLTPWLEVGLNWKKRA
jgi:hypothetical protein